MANSLALDPWAEFPDATPDPWAEFPDASPTVTTAAAAPEAAPVLRGPEPTDADLPVPGTPIKQGYQPDLADQIMSGVGTAVGAPVDLVNTILQSTGMPVSDQPFLGSKSVEGMLQSYTGNKERRQIAASSPDLPMDDGASLGDRLYSSFLATPEARNLFLTRTYGPEGEGWHQLKDMFGLPTDRTVVKGPDGKEKLFNPPGIDLGDLVGLLGSAPDLAGAVAGGAASTPAYVFGPAAGIPASAALSAGGAQIVGETVGRFFPENRQAEPDVLAQVVPRAAGEAAVDALLGLVTGVGSKLGAAGINTVKAPFAASAADPMAVEFRDAAKRLKANGYDINPLPSEEGAGGFVPRAEGLLEKLPGSSEKMRQYRQAGDQAISQFQDDLAGGADAGSIGRQVASELETQRKNLIIDREDALDAADGMTSANETNLVQRQGPQMSAEEAGATTKAGYRRARDEFQSEAKRLYDIARQAAGGADPIVDISAVRTQVQRIRDALPPSVDPATPDAQFTPVGLTRLLQGIDNMAPQITIDQARQMRSIIDDALDDTNVMPGVSDRYLTQLREAVSRAIDGSVASAGSPQLQSALRAANTFYRDNVDKFSRKGVAEAFRDPTSGGYVEDNQIIARLLSGRGKPGVIQETRQMLGVNSPEWQAFRRNAIEQILDTGRSKTLYGRRVVDADGLVGRLNSLDDDTVRQLFGVSDAQQLRNLAADISNRTKYLDAGALSQQGSPSILQQLRAAAVADEQIGRDYRDNVIAPFLRSETGARPKLNPEELVPWLYRKAAPYDVRNVMARLDPGQRSEVEKGVVADIIERAISRGGHDLASVRRLVTGEAGPAESSGIAELLGASRDAVGGQQAERIAMLLSPESRQALRDLALITARRQERDATNSAIGGLAAGSAITSMMTRPGQAIQSAAVARGLAELVTNPGVRKWLTNTNRIQVSPGTTATSIAIAPYLDKLLGGTIAEGSDLEAAINWLEGEAGQAGGALGVKPPKGYASWSDYFARNSKSH